MQTITKQVPATLALSALGAAVLLASQGALAAGLTLNEQSASAMGTAYAGRSSSALDASTVFGNPAGMSRLDRMQVSGGLALINARTSIKNAGATNNGAMPPGLYDPNDINANSRNRGNMVPLSAIPFGYFVMPLDDQWHFGMGIYAPVGGKSKFKDDFAGRFQARKTEVTMVTFQPTLSYKFNDMISVGAGATINYLDGTLSSHSLLLSPGGPIPAGTPLGEVLYTGKGDDTAIGANVGVLFQPYEDTTFGLTYRSEAKFKLTGDAKVEHKPDATTPVDLGTVNGKANLKFTAPESIDFSFTHKFDDQWTLYAGAVWTRWSRLEQVNIYDNLDLSAWGSTPTGVNPREKVNFKDTWAYSIGGSYQVNPAVVLRAGFALDTSAATNENRSVRTPIAERKAITIGAGWNVSQNLTLDAAYGYLWESDAKVDQADKWTGTDTNSPRPGYKGTFKNKIHGLSGQVTYRF